MKITKVISKLKRRIKKGNLSYEGKMYLISHLTTLKSKL